MEPETVFYVALALLAALIVHALIRAADRERILKAVRARGHRDVEIHWAPFSPGWFGSGQDRQYRVVFRDPDGERHERLCRTSAFSGVYWRD